MAAPPDDWTARSPSCPRCWHAPDSAIARHSPAVRRTSAHLFAVVLRINRDRAQAEDILQEVYVNVWRAARGFDAAQSQPLTWLTSIARNRAIDSLRRQQTQPQLQSSTPARRRRARTTTCTTPWPTKRPARSIC